MARRTSVDCGERQVAASDGCLGAETVFEYACTASHGGYFVLVAFRVVGFPVVTLVEGGVQVQEVREETACGDLAGKLVEVVVAVFGQIAYAAFLFPYLNGEDGRFAVAQPWYVLFSSSRMMQRPSAEVSVP